MMYLTFLGLFYCLVVYFSQQVFRQKIALHSLKAMGCVGVDVWLRVPVGKMKYVWMYGYKYIHEFYSVSDTKKNMLSGL